MKSSSLSSLKAAQLLYVSRITGVPQSGPKLSLVRRIRRAILQCQVPIPRNNGRPSGGLCNSEREYASGMNILSIDVGIRNLGVAHFVVSNVNDGDIVNARPILNAWYRVRVSDIDVSSDANVDLDLDTASSQGEQLDDAGEGSQPLEMSESMSEQRIAEAEDHDNKRTKRKIGKRKGNFSFTLPAYAARAYAVLDSLLEKHQPTHVLIERQRFRSVGSSAVQEWTLRVGIFEAMLHATLHTYRKRELLRNQSSQEHQSPAATPLVFVVEPQRVLRYWRLVTGSTTLGKSEKGIIAYPEKLSPDHVKRTKVDLVAKWLRDNMEAEAYTAHHEDEYRGQSADDEEVKIPMRVSKNREIREMVDAYLDRLTDGIKTVRGKRTRGNGKITSRPEGVDKLDDLADCVLQGVAWWEWQVNRYRIKDGVDSSVLREADAFSSV